jgi:hypothetical protein
MRRLLRILFNALTVLSLVLPLLVALPWARSYWRSDAIVFVGPSGHWAVQVAQGSVIVGKDDVGQPKRTLYLDSWPVDFNFLSALNLSWELWGSDLTRRFIRAACIRVLLSSRCGAQCY